MDQQTPIKVLVAGADGQLARSLIEATATRTREFNLVALGPPTLDLCDRASLLGALDRTAPALVINAAAYTAVDRAESEPELAFAVNCDGAGTLAEITSERDIPLIHISTDYVFDGAKSGAYQETDATNPQSVYGRSKRAGEERVASANPQHLILRTSWLYSPYGGNFVKTMLRLAAERPELKVVNDQHGNPTFAADLAAAILVMASRVAGDTSGRAAWGTYHVAGAGDTTWHGFAERILAAAARQGHAPAVPVRPIATSEFRTPARRPANSRLDCRKLDRVFDLRLPPWADGVERCVAQLCASP
jgi:dTDP-4-dehydrorhamnose reductase